ncbi:hypothetical protein DL770_001115 [Monosporascus sp. CRB-9-2]|nr:hypothetical protein DL770_001115 [Monosporascus sp. CRB-9-2]
MHLAFQQQQPQFFFKAIVKMAPNLAESQHNQIRDISKSEFKNDTIDRSVRCSTRAVKRIRPKLRYFGTTNAPPNGVGRGWRCRADSAKSKYAFRGMGWKRFAIDLSELPDQESIGRGSWVKGRNKSERSNITLFK